MPPSVKPPTPSNHGHPAKEYLEHHGINPHKQPIRSSQYGTALADPFRFYLTVILGLRRAYTTSKALNAGSWAHTAAEFHGDDEGYRKQLITVIKNMKEVGNALRLPSDFIEGSLEREQFYADTAHAWWDIVSKISLPNGITISHLFDQSANFHIVAREPRITAPGGVLGALLPDATIKTDIVIQPDAIAVNKTAKKIWLIDYKSTGIPTAERLSMCPNEFQCQLYTLTVDALHEQGLLADKVPPLREYQDYTIAGMLHLAYQKPTIKFGKEDRPYRWVSDGKRKGIWATIEQAPRSPTFHVKSMGPDKAWKKSEGYSSIDDALAYMHELTGKKPEKQFEDEPDINIYHHRCSDWYHAVGEYAHLAAERNASPVVNQSTVPLSLLKEARYLCEFEKRITLLDNWHRTLPYPDLFPKSDYPCGIGQTPSSDPYFPFYVSPIEDWPAIILGKQLIQAPRD